MSEVSKFLQGNPEQCRSCIFRHDGLQLKPERLTEICNYVVQGYQHVCHSDRRYACRGGHDLQVRTFYLMGLIDEPTDEGLSEANTKYLAQENKS